MRGWAAVVVVVAGCEAESNPYLRLIVDKNGVEIDHLVVVGSTRVLQVETAALTPELLLAGITTPPTAERWDYSLGSSLSPIDMPGPGDSTEDIVWDENTGGASTMFIAIGRLDNVAVAAARFELTSAMIGDEDGEFTRRIALTTIDVEEWGTGQGCVRYGTETYLINPRDGDCDGQELDCQPFHFCDPTATSGPLADACVCP